MMKALNWKTIVLILAMLAGVSLAVWTFWDGSENRREEPEELYRNVPIDPNQNQRIVFWDLHYPMQQPGYEHYLQAARAAFRKQFPNIELEIRIFGWSEVEDLKRALAEQEHVDVLGTAWNDFPLPETVPVDPFLRRDKDEVEVPEKDLYLDAAWEAVERNGQLTVWPRWLAVPHWFVDLEAAKKQQIDIPWQEWQRTGWSLAEAKELGVLDQAVFIRDAATFPENAVHFLSEAAKRRWVLAGGFDPSWGRRLLQMTGYKLLPPPEDAPQQDQLAVSGLAVIHHREHPGDQHVQAAVEWARFLSSWRPGHPLTHQLAVPAYRPGLQEWNRVSGLDSQVISQLLLEVYKSH